MSSKRGLVAALVFYCGGACTAPVERGLDAAVTDTERVEHGEDSGTQHRDGESAPADAGPIAEDASESTDAPAPPDGGVVEAMPYPDASVNADATVVDTGAHAWYAPDYCAYFLTGEIDRSGTDADGDGVTNGWDHCPNNPEEWLDSDRDGVGNFHDPDLDGDGIPNQVDPDRDGDGADDAEELTAGSDPDDPSSMPGVPRFDVDLGVKNPAPGWYRGDLHVHTTYSEDGHGQLANYIPAAQNAGLDFLWITDHRTFDAPFDPDWNQPDFLFIPAEEWGGPCHANMGGIRTVNIADYGNWDDVRRAWRLARLQGAVQSLNHYGSSAENWDNMFAAAPDLKDQVEVMEAWNSLWQFNRDTNDSSVAYYNGLLSEGRRIGAVGGSDSHYTNLTLGMPTTVVWAESLSVFGILDGIRRGRTYITQSEPYRDGLSLSWDNRAELDFRIDADGDGVLEATLGDEVPSGPLTLQVTVRHAHGPVVIIRNGTELVRFDSHVDGADITETHVDDAPPGAWYRVQMRKSALASSAMLLFSSPIYVRP